MLINKLINYIVQRWSLSTRLSILFLILLVVPLLLVVAWSDAQARSTITDQQERMLLRTSQSLAEKLDLVLKDNLDEVQNVADNPVTRTFVELNAPQDNEADLQIAQAFTQNALDSLLTTNDSFQTTYVLSKNGYILLASNQQGSHQIQILEPFFGQLPLSSTITEIGISQITKRPAFYYIVPIKANYQLIGYIAVHSNLTQIWRFINLENNRYSEGSFASLIDQAGIYLADGREVAQAGTVYQYVLHIVAPIAETERASLLVNNRFDTQKLNSFEQPELLSNLRTGDHNIAFTYVDKQSDNLFTIAATPMLTKNWLVVQEIPQRAFIAPINQMTLTSIAGLIVIAILASLLILNVIRSALRPFLRLQTPMDRIAEGDLSNCRIVTDGGKEVRSIAIAFEHMATNLQSLVGQVRQSSSVVVVAADAVQTTSQQQLTVTKQQDRTIAQTTDAMEELVRAARKITDSSRQVSKTAAKTLGISNQVLQLTDKAAHEINDSRSQIEDSMTQILHMRNQVGSINLHVIALDGTVEDIDKVIDFMEEIASEIHLLSLNAAIEAAGAGEYGDRFAVVAAEVKQLASRSHSATKQVRQLIGNIQTATKQVVTVVEEGLRNADQTWQQVEQIKVLIEQISHAISNVADGTPEIVEAAKLAAQTAREISVITEQQLGSSNHVLDLLREIGQTVQEGMITHRKTINVSTELSERANDLNEAISRFRLN